MQTTQIEMRKTKWAGRVAAVAMSFLFVCSSWGGPEVPFPYTEREQIQFPWANIEGTWKATNNAIATEFSIRLISESSRTRILQIFQINPTDKSVIAEGHGIAASELNVQGVLTSFTPSGRRSYTLLLRAFQPANGSVAYVATIVSRGSDDQVRTTHLMMSKISNRPAVSPKPVPKIEDIPMSSN